jgi:hypothetical protein
VSTARRGNLQPVPVLRLENLSAVFMVVGNPYRWDGEAIDLLPQSF